MLQNYCFSFHDCFSFHFWKWIFQVMDSYFSLLNLSFNWHISIFTTFPKQSMINRLSNAINRNHLAAKISKVMSSKYNTPMHAFIISKNTNTSTVYTYKYNLPMHSFIISKNIHSNTIQYKYSVHIQIQVQKIATGESL